MNWLLIIALVLPAQRDREHKERHIMAAAITATWAGTTGDAALYSNWSGGLPRDTSDTIIIPSSNSQAITSNLGAIPAFETLTLTGQPLDTETVVIDAKTYTFQTVLTDVDGNVQIGGDTNTSLGNLIKAINLTGVAGTDYAASMTVHPTAYATDEAGDTMDAVYRTAGTGGNGTTTTETLTNGSWGAASMSGGAANGLSIASMILKKGRNAGVMTSGSPAFMHTVRLIQESNAPLYFRFPTATEGDIICNSPNRENAITFSGNADITGTYRLQILSGKVVWNSTGDVAITYMTSSKAILSIVSSTVTFTSVWMADGLLDADCIITNLYKSAGTMVKTANKVTNMHHLGGHSVIRDITDDTTTGSAGTQWYVVDGVLDLTEGSSLINVVALEVFPQATIIEDADLTTWVRTNVGE